MKPCPWCGKTLADNPDVCTYCQWTRKGYNMRPALKAYGFFILLCIILGIATFKYVSYITRDVNVKALGAFIDIRNGEGLNSWR